MGFFSLSKKLGATVVTAAVLMMARKANADYWNGYSWYEGSRPGEHDAVIYGYDGPGGNITIPAQIEGHPVTLIWRETFYQNPNITGVTIPNSVSYIDDSAFAGCPNLQQVIIDGNDAFIDGGAFAGCQNLESVEIKGGVGTIWSSAFANCINLRTISIGNGVHDIGQEAFSGCVSLESIRLPSSLGYLGIYAFQNCTGLKSVTLPSHFSGIMSGTFSGCSSLTDIKLPRSLLGIGDRTFEGCSNLKSITIPQNVQGLSDRAFQNCSSLTKVCFEGSPPLTGSFTFQGAPVSQIYYLSNYSTWPTTFLGIPTSPCIQCFGLATDVSPTGPAEVEPIPPSDGKTNLVMVIHGWRPLWSVLPFMSGKDMPELKKAIAKRLNDDGLGDQWNVELTDWRWSSLRLFPQAAVRNASKLGKQMGADIAGKGYKRVYLIGHSAGTWMAHELGKDLTARNIDVSVTFLDAYVPSEAGLKIRGSDDLYSPEELGNGLATVEHYYHTNDLWGLGHPLTHAVDHDITNLRICEKDRKDWHGWPIRWFTKTVANPNYSSVPGLGYDIPVNTLPAEGPVPCVENLQAMMLQSQELNTAVPTSAVRRALNVATPPPPLPPALDAEAIAALRQKTLAARAARAELEVAKTAEEVLTVQNGAELVSGQSTEQARLLTQDSVLNFANFAEVTRGGSGTISTNAEGIELTTTNFVWGTFSVNSTNGFNFGAVGYELSTACNNIVGLWIDGEPVTLIESAPEHPLETAESFPLAKALGSGNHLLTVSLESVDKTPVSATFRELGLYLAVEQPEITSHSVTNGQFQMEWDAGAGLKYQPQFNDSLTSTNWSNLGGLRTSPTNAIMSAFDAISTNSQRFYRIKLSAD